MKAESRVSVTKNKKPRIHQPAEIRVDAVPAWSPQPNPLTREEIRKLVIDQIG
jgi:hypothetical protein